jgi:hypothetical protein
VGGEEPFAPFPGTGEIHEDPLFRDPSSQDYRLSLGSPCIDAGWPDSPLDPDGTVADMGAVFFYHVAEVAIAPENPPIIIPPPGGSFRFEATIANTSDSGVEVDVWTMANVPGVGYFGPLIMRRLHLSPQQTVYRSGLPQNVPGYAPGGTYYYIGYVGNYPEKMDSSSFEFTKTGESAGGRWFTGDWSDGATELSVPITASLVGNYPNPFNGSTNINYELFSEETVKLEVFSLLGEKVATLVDGWQPAGAGTVTWDASDLSSGVYFCKLTTGDFTETRRMLFAK